MAVEVIKDIKSAEEKADAIIKESQLESKDIIKNANIKAQNDYDSIINETKDKVKTIMEEAISLGEEEATPILELGKKKKEDILNVSQDRFQEAVKLVIERIVSINGDS